MNIKNISKKNHEPIGIIKSVQNLSDRKIKKLKISDIHLQEELVNKFKMDEETKNRIKDDMQLNGFSKAHPLHVWQSEGKFILVDEHTRFKAATELGLSHIWAQIHQFKDLNEALTYSMQEQFNRRNITDSELFKEYEILRLEEVNGRKLTMQEKADKLKKSKRHLSKIEEITKKADAQTIQDIREGKTSINKVYNEIKKKEQADAEAEANEINLAKKQNELQEQNSFDESIDEQKIEEKFEADEQNRIVEKMRELEKREIELNTRERVLNLKTISHKSRFSDVEILKIGIQFAYKEFSSGKTVDEILSRNDLSELLFQNQSD